MENKKNDIKYLKYRDAYKTDAKWAPALDNGLLYTYGYEGDWVEDSYFWREYNFNGYDFDWEEISFEEFQDIAKDYVQRRDTWFKRLSPEKQALWLQHKHRDGSSLNVFTSKELGL